MPRVWCPTLVIWLKETGVPKDSFRWLKTRQFRTSRGEWRSLRASNSIKKSVEIFQNTHVGGRTWGNMGPKIFIVDRAYRGWKAIGSWWSIWAEELVRCSDRRSWHVPSQPSIPYGPGHCWPCGHGCEGLIEQLGVFFGWVKSKNCWCFICFHPPN